MPMYEYRCQDCSKLYEQLRRMSDADTNLQCPHCGGHQVQRQVSTCSFAGTSSGNSGGNSGGGCAPRGGFS